MLKKGGAADKIKSEGLWTGDNSNLNGGVIAFDLDFAVQLANSPTTTCDLWEEIRSDDIFWNKFTTRRALLIGADFANAQGDNTRATN